MKTRNVIKAFVVAIIAMALVWRTADFNCFAMTTSEIQSKMDKYCETVKAKYTTPHWNAGLGEQTLRTAINNGDLLTGLTGSACKTGGSSHLTVNGCTSNTFMGQTQCLGFSKYFLYYLYGAYPTVSFYNIVPGSEQNGFQLFKKGVDYPGLIAGDYFFWVLPNGSMHAAIVYECKDGTISVIDCNTSSDYCVVHLKKAIYIPYAQNPNSGATTGNEAALKSLYEAGYVYIARRTDTTVSTPTVCNHSFKRICNYIVKCTTCKMSMSINDVEVIPVNAYMDISAVNKSSKTAPSHTSFFGDARIVTRFKMNDTVYVVGYTFNMYGNQWMKLSTGEWLTADYLSPHTHVMRNGACQKCPYYETTVEYGIVRGAWGGLALNDAPAASPRYSNELAAIPNGAQVEILSREGKWYTVRYNGVVGFAYGAYIK